MPPPPPPFPPAPFVLSAKTVIVPGMNARSLSFRRRLLSTRSQCSSNGRRSTSTREEKRNLSEISISKEEEEDTNSPSSLPTCFGAPHKPDKKKNERDEGKKVEFDDDVVRRAWVRSLSSVSRFLKSALRVETAIFFKGEARFSKKRWKIVPHLGF